MDRMPNAYDNDGTDFNYGYNILDDEDPEAWAKRVETIAKRRRQRARRVAALKAELYRRLGPCCEVCGYEGDPTVDHVDGRDWHPRKMGIESRYKKYLAELDAGDRLRRLCAACNYKHGADITNGVIDNWPPPNPKREWVKGQPTPQRRKTGT